MAKSAPFFEVFPNLKLDNDLSTVLKDAMVTRIVKNPTGTVIRIYLDIKTLIPYRRIKKLEEEINQQLFPSESVAIYIMENYILSDAYTPEVLFERYKDSMLDELTSLGGLYETIFRKADVEFDSNKMNVTIEDLPVYKELEDELYDFLNTVLNKRCNKNIEIAFSYKKATKNRLMAEREAAFESKLSLIKENAMRAQAMAQLAEKDSDSVNDDDKLKFKSYKKSSSKHNSSGGRQKRIKYSDREDVILGHEIDDDAILISEIIEGIGTITVRGQIMSFEKREIKNENNILSFAITDFTDSIKCKLFVKNEFISEVEPKLQQGAFIKIKGQVELDKFDHELEISNPVGIMSIPDFREQKIRMDNMSKKRVELHLHTQMSDMDGVSSIKDIMKRAASWGHTALAITDHGVVQAFTDAYHTKSDCPNLKVIYGCEAYIVDDEKKIVTNSKGQSLDDTEFVVFDIETTGFSAKANRIIEIGAVKVKNGEITDTFSEFINPGVPIPYKIVDLTGITDDMVKDASDVEVVLPKFIEFCKGCVMVAHNADFDMSFIDSNCLKLGLSCPETYIDTVGLSRFLMPHNKNHKLDTVCKLLGISLENHHRAVDDATATGYIFKKFYEMLKSRDIFTLDDINENGKLTQNDIKKLPSYHCIILAKNDIGRINLYRLVSESHLNYYFRRPRMPKSLINKYREGLIIGSACEAGELFRAIVGGRNDEEIARIVDFYDYLEIQPVGNNMFMLKKDDNHYETVEDLQNINREIVKLGETYNKPVCATCDVHFLDPEDEVYRRILMAGKGFDDADDQAPLYLRTTEEMLDEFAYLGSDKAYEVVVDNTNYIANMCDVIAPVRPDKAPPVIENSAEDLRRICYTKAHEVYGDPLPQIVKDRLDRELNSIIGNGYAVMYIIAQKLVWKSVEDGYLVGSRGSVGSSFAATMAGITEVNPLSPHYICPECKYSDFDSPEVLEFAGRAGCDMPDKICPKCGAKLNKDGFDIPFETFLGFKGNKEPDIDLNFSNYYQSKAHKYAEVIFGEGQTYKAGTVGTVAEKTAYGYVRKYYEERGLYKRGCEIDRIKEGCLGVRSSTGQHPGGIIVLPMGEDIYSFTPIQHPANKDVDIITTHFDYHSIDSNLLKLDMLGHLDPTMVRMLEDLTGLDATTIPLDDKEVLSLFQNTSALGVSPNDLYKNCDIGTLGIPEFGTDNAMKMLRTAKPKELTDLVRISGLAHGTDVWKGNAEDLILSGTATISTAICTRDDIMTYLIHMGLDSAESFDIMEKVRKGAVAKGKVKEAWEGWKKDMIDHGVPDWYIGSCEKIQYMFPKAHAAAYVMMGFRVGYYKINYPLAYYAAFFSIRGKGFNYEKMCLGENVLIAYLDEIDYKKANGAISSTEEDAMSVGRLVQEMYARGFEFLPMDLYNSDSRHFKIVDGKLLPPFNVIEGMGDSMAEDLMIAASKGKFLSKDDLKSRGKISQTILETFDRIGITKGMTQSNQISLFDM